jgi:hypothetical protein
MKMIPRLTALLTLCAMLASASVACADDNIFRETFQDAFYGGAVGTLVGVALLAFTKKPADHLDYMAYGAATGILAGAAFGAVKATRSLATVENGNVRIAMPTFIPDLVDAPLSKQTIICWRANLLRGTFD